MEQILLYREKIVVFLSKHTKNMKSIFKFIGGFFLFYVINNLFGYQPTLSQNLVTVLLAAICTFLPLSLIYLLCQLIIVIQLSAYSLEAFLFYVIIFGLYHLIYQRIFPELRYLVIMTPVFFYFHIPVFVPLFVGTFVGISGIPAIVIGSLVYYYGTTLKASALQIGAGSNELYNLVIQKTIANKQFLIVILAFIFVALLVLTIRRVQIAYAWYVSIFTGGIAYVIITLIGGFMISGSVSVPLEIGVAVAVVFILSSMQFFDNVIDYSREENLEFEDDEYYYYVRAIPKSIVKEEDVNITKINHPRPQFSFKRKTRE